MIKKNLTSNFSAKFWNTFISIIIVPYYVQFLGIEAYGLMGIYASITAILSLLDLGLGTTASREMATMLALPGISKVRSFIRTLEVIYWGVGLLIVFVFFFFSQAVVHFWFQNSHFTLEVLEKVVKCMGIAFAALWPFALYGGSLMGMEKQTTLNWITCSFTTFRALGSLAVLAFVSCTIEAFFIFQAAVNLIQTFVGALITWRSLPTQEAFSRFDWGVLKKIRRYAFGISGISVTVVILTQLDKLILSKFLSLEMFGSYVLAYTVANGISQLTGPVFMAFFPRFSSNIAQGNEPRLAQLYHLGAQLVTCLILPIAACLVFFSLPIMNVWGVSLQVAQKTAVLMPILVLGTTINSLLSIPYTLQLAYGWTRLAFLQNIIAIVVLIGPLIWAVKNFGGMGAAYVWLLLNVGYIVFSIPVMHKRILKNEIRAWYVRDCLIPIIATFLILFLFNLFFSLPIGRYQCFWFLAAAFSVTTMVCVLSAPLIRFKLFTSIKSFYLKKGQVHE